METWTRRKDSPVNRNDCILLVNVKVMKISMEVALFFKYFLEFIEILGSSGSTAGSETHTPRATNNQATPTESRQPSTSNVPIINPFINYAKPRP